MPCRRGVRPLTRAAIKPFAAMVPDWSVVRGHHLHKVVRTRDFSASLALANRIGVLAEKAGHHPDLLVAWGRVGIDIFTHKIDGLTPTDFILAARLDELKPR